MASECVPLQELCLEVIIGEMSRFTNVFIRTVDESLKRNFLFLQRVYSQDLLDELVKRGELKEDHLVFLLNNFLKKIDLDSLLCFTSKDNLIEKVVPISHCLSELTCTDEHANDGITTLTALLPHLNNVRKLSIRNVCNDEMLKIITASCPHLTDLDIKKSVSVSSLGVQTLYTDPGGSVQVHCPLTRLNLLYTDVTNEEVGNILKNIPTIQELIFDDLPEAIYSLHKADLDNNTLSEVKKYNLIYLRFDGSYKDSSLEIRLKLCAELCPRVKKLRIDVEDEVRDDFQLCSLFTELESITVYNQVEEYALDLNSFIKAGGGKLKELDASYCSLSVSTLVQNCPSLVSIALRDCNYMQLDRNIVNKLSSLQELEFDLGQPLLDSHNSESLEMLLSASPNLKSFIVTGTDSEFYHKLATSFTKCSIKHLSVSYSDIEIDSLEQVVLSCGKKLESLHLDDCRDISTDDIERLKSHTFDAFKRKIKIDFIDRFY